VHVPPNPNNYDGTYWSNCADTPLTTYKHTLAHTHTHKHTHIHTRTHTHSRTDTLIHTLTRTHSYTHMKQTGMPRSTLLLPPTRSCKLPPLKHPLAPLCPSATPCPQPCLPWNLCRWGEGGLQRQWRQQKPRREVFLVGRTLCAMPPLRVRSRWGVKWKQGRNSVGYPLLGIYIQLKVRCYVRDGHLHFGDGFSSSTADCKRV
jgi:hypothetical protein